MPPFLRTFLKISLNGIITNYILLCFLEAYAWSSQISSSFGLMLIRLIVVLFLTLIDFFALPFRYPYLFKAFLYNSIIFIPIWALAYSIFARKHFPFTKKLNESSTIFTIFIGILLSVYWYNFYVNGAQESFYSYISKSSFLLYPSIFASLFWIYYNLEGDNNKG